MCDEHVGYLTRWAHIAASIALNDESLHNSLTQTFRYRAARAAINIIQAELRILSHHNFIWISSAVAYVGLINFWVHARL